jgi:ribosomal protein S18 acetylase RimI-like enzyme
MFFSNATKQLASFFGQEDLAATARIVFKYLKRGLAQTHVYVVGHPISRDNPILATETDLEIKQMTVHDNDDIDELIAIDEWPISKSDTVKMLEKGQLCYIAKHQGHLVACGWVIITEKFEDYFLRRQLWLAPNEAYYWRTMTLPSFRGRGIVPYLLAQIDADLGRRFGKTYGLGWVRTNNKPMLRAVGKIGRIQVGRMGFFQVLNIRFHYLLGPRAFSRTKPRLKVQMLRLSWRNLSSVSEQGHVVH